MYDPPSGRNHTPDVSITSGQPGRRLADVEQEDAPPARLDRQLDAGHRRDLAGPRTRRVDDRSAGEPSAGGQPDRIDPSGPTLQSHDLVTHELDAAGERSLAQRLQQTETVEPSFAGKPQRPGLDIVEEHPREAFGERRAIAAGRHRAPSARWTACTSRSVAALSGRARYR